MQESVIEYFNTYFGGELNESITHEDLIEAALDLIELRNEVLKEADVGRASRALGARKYLDKATKDPSTRDAMMNTKEGQRLIKRHERPYVPHVDPKKIKKKKLFLGLDYGQNSPKPTTHLQRTKKLAQKSLEAGPEGQQQYKYVPDDKERHHRRPADEKGNIINTTGWLKRHQQEKLPTSDDFHASAKAQHTQGYDDMQARIARIKDQGKASAKTKKAIGINSSYDPRLKENDEKNKILKFRKDDEGPHELGLRNVIRDTQLSADKNRAEVEKENQLAALLKVDTTKSPSQARREIRKLAKETEQSRASQGKHRARGAEGRRKREEKGQGRLF